jgi:hypothetical protein
MSTTEAVEMGGLTRQMSRGSEWGIAYHKSLAVGAGKSSHVSKYGCDSDMSSASQTVYVRILDKMRYFLADVSGRGGGEHAGGDAMVLVLKHGSERQDLSCIVRKQCDQ